MKKIFSLLYLFICSVLCFSQIHDTVSIHDVEIKDMGEYVQIGDEHILVSDSVGNLSIPAVEVCYAGEIESELGAEVEIISGEILF